MTTTVHNAKQAAVPSDAPGWLEALRRYSDARKNNHAELARIVEGLSNTVSRTLTEHRGFADELLSVYEQLGSVFEVTRRLSTVQRERDVVALFLDSLERTFAGRTVFALMRDRHHRWTSARRDIPITDWFSRCLDHVHDKRQVIVEAVPPGAFVQGAQQIMLGPVVAGDVFVCAIALVQGEGVPAFRAVDMALLKSLTAYCGDLIGNHRLVRELRNLSITMVRSLVSAVDQKDEYTSGHSLRVGYYATLLGRRLGLGDADLQMLQWSALLHDVGKIGIRDDVLKKEGKLTDAEMEHVKEHPVRSHKVVQQVPQLVKALDGVLHHHERFDGRGYPLGLRGDQIPLQARIIQVADVFDALTSNRSYRSAFSWRKALRILEEEAGSVVDPHLQQTFANLIHEILDDDDGAWPGLVARATQFSQLSALDDTDDPPGE